MSRMKTIHTNVNRALVGLCVCSFLVACKGGDEKGVGKPAPVAKKSEPKKIDNAKAEKPDEPPLDPRVAKAAKLAGEIEAAPENADEILEKHGLDRDKLDALMYEIASDQSLAEDYKLARAEGKAPAADKAPPAAKN